MKVRAESVGEELREFKEFKELRGFEGTRMGETARRRIGVDLGLCYRMGPVRHMGPM
jgi:hypothetical protein